MVVTFNSRLASLTDKCKPSTVKRQGSLMAHIQHHGSHSRSRPISHNSHPHHDGNHYSNHGHGATSNKRRRHKEEIEYAAATIQIALSDAGRPSPLTAVSRRERALPLGSVDMDGAKVVLSREFDTCTNDDGDENEDCREDAKKKKDSNGGTSSASNADDYNLFSMYVIAGLIKSTQNYYCFSSDDSTNSNNNTMTTQTANSAAEDTSTGNSNSNTPPIAMKDEKFSEDNSEGLSSWAPSSSSCRHHFNYCDKKAIDNDNRSDEQSIDNNMAKEESSSSSLDSLASNDGVVECKNYDGPYSVIG